MEKVKMDSLRTHYIKKPMKQIYVIENEHGLVKIGVSQNVSSRINVLSKQGGFKVRNIYSTKPCSNSYVIENQIHHKLKSLRINGEWFSIPFCEAVNLTIDCFTSMANFEVNKVKCIMPEDVEHLFCV